jgi:glycosyltransferase involved in cell wall biosynthesis
MKILHVIPSFVPAWRYGGPVFAAAGLTKALAKSGHVVTVFTTNIDGPELLDVPVTQEINLNGVNVWYFPVQRPRRYCASELLSNELQRRLLEFDIVHIHSVFLWPTTIASYWCRRLHVPYIIRPAGMLDPICMTKPYMSLWRSAPSRLKKHLYLRTLGEIEIRSAAAVHFTSEQEKQESRLPFRSPRAIIVPLGVELAEAIPEERTDSVYQLFPKLKGKKVVLFLSRLDPMKGLDLLCAASHLLFKKRDDFVLVIAGAGPVSFQRSIQRLTQRYGIADQVLFTGMVIGREKQALLNVADVFVLPSYHENFGLAVTEAMANGIPVIISDRVNISEAIKDAGAGSVVKLDATDIATAIASTLDDAAGARKMAENGRTLVRSRFNWDRIAADLLHLYAEIVRDHRTACNSWKGN